ncbi:GNAT family N-acetyltransferase [Rhodococcus sp. ACT016]|uniref:GNAT family N-acetyltransferase n=1 Tax=Rhodococcus sp. ACT016 TaxID=3134808 RepID=UPI003D29A8A3
MTTFSRAIDDYWRAQFSTGRVLCSSDSFRITTNPDLDEDNRISVLTTTDGNVSVALTPPLADDLGLSHGRDLDEATFRQLLRRAGVGLNGADNVFYFSEAGRRALTDPTTDRVDDTVRRLTAADAELFATFEASASEEDMDDAYVKLDHWAVFGSFEDERLVGAGSMYSWDEAEIADFGVLTLAPFRGKGHARRLVRAMSRYAYGEGYEPQYRCQFDNQASVAVAEAAGLTLFGTWEAEPED